MEICLPRVTQLGSISLVAPQSDSYGIGYYGNVHQMMSRWSSEGEGGKRARPIGAMALDDGNEREQVGTLQQKQLVNVWWSR